MPEGPDLSLAPPPAGLPGVKPAAPADAGGPSARLRLAQIEQQNLDIVLGVVDRSIEQSRRAREEAEAQRREREAEEARQAERRARRDRDAEQQEQADAQAAVERLAARADAIARETARLEAAKPDLLDEWIRRLDVQG
jgi:hypothetical protein